MKGFTVLRDQPMHTMSLVLKVTSVMLVVHSLYYVHLVHTKIYWSKACVKHVLKDITVIVQYWVVGKELYHMSHLSLVLLVTTVPMEQNLILNILVLMAHLAMRQNDMMFLTASNVYLDNTVMELDS
jgi:hypothetical protein